VGELTEPEAERNAGGGTGSRGHGHGHGHTMLMKRHDLCTEEMTWTRRLQGLQPYLNSD